VSIRALVSSSFYKDTNPLLGPHLIMTLSESDYLPKAPPPNTSTLRVRASTKEHGGRHMHLVPNRWSQPFDGILLSP